MLLLSVTLLHLCENTQWHTSLSQRSFKGKFSPGLILLIKTRRLERTCLVLRTWTPPLIFLLTVYPLNVRGLAEGESDWRDTVLFGLWLKPDSECLQCWGLGLWPFWSFHNLEYLGFGTKWLSLCWGFFLPRSDGLWSSLAVAVLLWRCWLDNGMVSLLPFGESRTSRWVEDKTSVRKTKGYTRAAGCTDYPEYCDNDVTCDM